MRSAAAIAAAAPLLLAACVRAGTPEADTDAVELMSTWRDVEADRFADVLAPLESVTGIDVQYVGSGDFEHDLRQRVADGADPPDIALIPQLGLVSELADEGLLEPLSDGLREDVLETYGAFDTTVGDGDEVFAVPFRLTVKSLVWYRPDVFEEHGWEVPGTLGELEQLVDTIEDESDIAPWCFAIRSGSATGWAATDWVEDLVLRSAGPDVYEDWVTGEVTFADDEIAEAFASFESLVLASGRTAGGTRAILETPVADGWRPLFGEPPGCAMYKQADFARSWMPDELDVGPDGDVDVFALPGVSADETPLVVGGNQIVQFTQGPEVDEVMAYLATADAASIWARQGGFIAANPEVGDDVYPERFRASIDRAAERASAIEFDASDSMPPDVGTELYWDEISSWVAGTIDYATLAATLDEAMAAALEDRA